MPELDLIPQDYRELQQARLTVKLCLLSIIVLVIAIVIGKVMLHEHVTNLVNSIDNFEQKRLVIQQQEQRISNLEDKKSILEERVNVLRSLREGPSAKKMFLVVDRAFVEGTWFKKWSFRYDGELSDINTTEAFNTNPFLLIKDKKNPAIEKVWRLNTHMAITGGATNHSNLADLVSKFIALPEIGNVQVLRTASKKYTAGEMVDFDLAITVNNHKANLL